MPACKVYSFLRYDGLPNDLQNRVSALAKIDQEDSGALRRARTLSLLTRSWTSEIVQHYQWQRAGRPTIEKLSELAKRCPDWSVAVQLINTAMLNRQAKWLRHKKGLRLGDFPGGSTLKDPKSPIIPANVMLVIRLHKSSECQTIFNDYDCLIERWLQRPHDPMPELDSAEIQFADTPDFPLQLDCFSTLVPWQPETVLKKRKPAEETASSPLKRRRVGCFDVIERMQSDVPGLSAKATSSAAPPALDHAINTEVEAEAEAAGFQVSSECLAGLFVAPTEASSLLAPPALDHASNPDVEAETEADGLQASPERFAGPFVEPGSRDCEDRHAEATAAAEELHAPESATTLPSFANTSNPYVFIGDQTAQSDADSQPIA
ncbi:hypothetical protein LTR82_015797 [Friedmanniomyces endolithicus]|uniref:Uncharacterized protein n=1 Tax=Friedmanniomyces endolithicus TaxID=329885 RepID=A0AAN6F9Y0_9PEZI|nr:hypothetical protein LTR82_015797 [Friedmanniomyces endolithicus]